MSLASLLRHEVDWQRPRITMDASRGNVRTFETLEEGVLCLVQPAKAKDRYLYRQRNVTLSHHIYFDRKLALKPEDRLFSQADQRYYVVTGWFDMGGQDGRAFRVDVYEQVL